MEVVLKIGDATQEETRAVDSDWIWSNIMEEMIAGHSESARQVSFKGTPDGVEAAIHSAQVALLRHRTRAIRDGRIRNYIPVIQKRGATVYVYNRPVGQYRRYVHRAQADVMDKLEALARRARGGD